MKIEIPNVPLTLNRLMDVESKFNKDESDQDNKTDQQKKSTSGFSKIKDKFSRRLGEK